MISTWKVKSISVWFNLPQEMHSIFAGEPMSLATGVRAMPPEHFNGLMGRPSHLHGRHPLHMPWTFKSRPRSLPKYFEPKKFDTYLNCYGMQQQILDVWVLVLLGTFCLLIFLMVFNDILSFSCIYTYKSGTVNSKSFIGKVLLQIKCKFELN